jgi:hypothetical protein
MLLHGAVGEHDQTEYAERLASVLNQLDDGAITPLALLDALSMSRLKLIEDRRGTAEHAYRDAVADMKHE